MPNNRRRLTGSVVSNRMDKTVVVQIDTRYRHPLYGKVVSKSRRFKAHDEGNECALGDTVVIVESRPISRTKRWVVEKIMRHDLSAQAVELGTLVETPVYTAENPSIVVPEPEPIDASDGATE